MVLKSIYYLSLFSPLNQLKTPPPPIFLLLRILETTKLFVAIRAQIQKCIDLFIYLVGCVCRGGFINFS